MKSIRNGRAVLSSCAGALLGGILALASVGCEPTVVVLVSSSGSEPTVVPGPLQWQWSDDQTVCKDPNGFDHKNEYPSVAVRQLVARDDESIYGVGDYVLPSRGLTSDYGISSWMWGYHFGDITAAGPHAFQLDVASGGGSASWSTLATYSLEECFQNSCLATCGTTCLDGTEGVGPFIEPAGGDVVFFLQRIGIRRLWSTPTTRTCDEGTFSKLATPQWSLGTNEVCAHGPLAFAGDAVGNVVVREDDRLKKYDPSGVVVLDVPTPFDFNPTALGLSPMGNIHAAAHSSTEIRLARTDASGTLAWSKTFTNANPTAGAGTIDLAVDALGNSVVAFYAHDTMDLGNGPMAPVGAKDIVLAKFDVSGNLVWAKRMGGGEIMVSQMRKTGANEIALVVHFKDTIELGGGVLQSSPVLVKFDGDGNLVWRADLLPLYPAAEPQVLSVAISGHPSGAVFVAGTGYGQAASTPEPECDLGGGHFPGTYPRPLRMFAAKYGP